LAVTLAALDAPGVAFADDAAPAPTEAAGAPSGAPPENTTVFVVHARLRRPIFVQDVDTKHHALVTDQGVRSSD
jgi:hypothetical protein